MAGYVLRRLILIIPTVFIILVLSFVLQSIAPGDEVVKKLELEGASQSLSKSTYLAAYRSLSEEYGLNTPKFYFSIRPNYFPDTLHRVIPKEKRSLLTSMLRQTKDWSQVNEFNRLLTQSIIEIENIKELRAVHNELLKMELDRSLSDIKARSVKIRNLNLDFENQPTSTDRLLAHIEKFTTRSIVSYPVLKFNGFSIQFQYWLTRIMSREKNVSLLDKAPVVPKILRALKWTASLSIMAIVFIAILALILGYTQVYFNDRILDKILSLILYVLLAVPTFWMASLLVVFFTTPEYGAWMDIFPSIGLKPSFVVRPFLHELMDNIGQLVLPVICLVLVDVSFLAIQLKSDMKEALSKPYVLMARAKGLNKKQLLKNQVLPNALLPFTTLVTGSIPAIFTGSVIIEVIFNIPGIGRLILTSVQNADWPVVFTIVVVISIATMIGYLIGDLVLIKLFPKSGQSFDRSQIKLNS